VTGEMKGETAETWGTGAGGPEVGVLVLAKAVTCKLYSFAFRTSDGLSCFQSKDCIACLNFIFVERLFYFIFSMYLI
jgi:hypothetical protein